MAALADSKAAFLIFIWELTEQNWREYCASYNFLRTETRLNYGIFFNKADSIIFEAVGDASIDFKWAFKLKIMASIYFVALESSFSFW